MTFLVGILVGSIVLWTVAGITYTIVGKGHGDYHDRHNKPRYPK